MYHVNSLHQILIENIAKIGQICCRGQFNYVSPIIFVISLSDSVCKLTKCHHNRIFSLRCQHNEYYISGRPASWIYNRDRPKPLFLVSAVAESGPKLNIQLQP